MDADCCIRPGFIEATRLLPRYGFTIDISVKNVVLPNVIRLARECPDVQFILDHIGKPDIAGQQWEPWRSQIKALSQLDNVVCKISGVPMEAGRGWSSESIRPYVEAIAESFGPNRILYGSDYPAQHPVATFGSWTTSIAEIMTVQSLDELDDYFYGNAMRVYRITDALNS